MRVDRLNEDFLKVMKDAGCYMVSYGFESYSPIVLKSMKKHITPEQIDNAVRLTLKNNVSVQGNFIFGDKAETIQTAHETLDYWKRNNNAGIILGFISPYPGTELYEYCVKKNIIKDKLDFIENHMSDVINMTNTITDNELEKLKSDIFETKLRHYIYVCPLSLKKMKNGAYNIKVKCPHCSENIEYKNYEIRFSVFFDFAMYCRNCRKRFFLESRLYRFARNLFLSPFINSKMKNDLSNARIGAGKIKRGIIGFMKKVSLND